MRYFAIRCITMQKEFYSELEKILKTARIKLFEL